MIVCLGWGSLIWNPGRLPVRGVWQSDGPSLPLEFARESEDGRMTLVIVDHDFPVPVLWSELAVKDIDEAHSVLSERENVRFAGSVGRLPTGRHQHQSAAVVGAWMQEKGFAGVVWTALRPGMRVDRTKKSYITPTLERIERHFSGLDAEARERAAQYVSAAPAQIVTPYRAALEAFLRAGA